MIFFLDVFVPGTPAISIVEAKKAICGSKQRLKVNIIPAAKSPGGSENWQRKKTVALDAKNKYSHDNSRQLAIKCTSKEDEGKYEAFLAQESNGNIYKILNNGIYLPQRSTMFFAIAINTSLGKMNNIHNLKRAEKIQ